MPKPTMCPRAGRGSGGGGILERRFVIRGMASLGAEIWIITEADRSTTTILLPMSTELILELHTRCQHESQDD